VDARRASGRRWDLEQHLRSATEPTRGDVGRDELLAAMDDELAGLPERLRVPLVLRYLEGKTLAEIARFFRVSVQAVAKRLSRGEDLLRERLEKRGLTLGGVAVATLLADSVSAPAIPVRLVEGTARAAAAFREGTLTGKAAEAAGAVLRSLPWEGM